MRYNCTKEGMGGTFKCIYYESVFQYDGTCIKSGGCDYKKPHPIDVFKNLSSSSTVKEEKTA